MYVRSCNVFSETEQRTKERNHIQREQKKKERQMETMNICTKHTGPRIYGYTDTCMNQILVVGLFAGISTQQAWKTASNY